MLCYYSRFRISNQATSHISSRLNRLNSPDMRVSSVLLSPVLQVSLGPIRPLTMVLVGSVCLVFLIACANAAGLMLAHGAGRSRELAVKSALGASRGRLIRNGFKPQRLATRGKALMLRRRLLRQFSFNGREWRQPSRDVFVAPRIIWASGSGGCVNTKLK
jgi:hypothetical protein